VTGPFGPGHITEVTKSGLAGLREAVKNAILEPPQE
jgi:hypothetical protein